MEKQILNDLLKRYDGRPLKMENLSRYEQWAYPFFQRKDLLVDSTIEMTFQFDVTEADALYRQNHAKEKGASFTAYLIWGLLQSMRRYPCFLDRYINGDWYRFENLPLFFPVAIGGDARFRDILLENILSANWPGFCERYRAAIEKSLAPGREHVRVSYELWSVALFIGNLPELSFTSLRFHHPTLQVGRSVFYLGKRTRGKNGRLTTPIHVLFDHSNVDPFILSAFFKTYESIIGKRDLPTGQLR